MKRTGIQQTICYVYSYSLFSFLAALSGMWDLSSLTRDLAHTPCNREAWSLNHWTSKKSPDCWLVFLSGLIMVAAGPGVIFFFSFLLDFLRL